MENAFGVLSKCMTAKFGPPTLPCLQKYFGSKVAENPRVAMSAKILWFKSGGEPQGCHVCKNTLVQKWRRTPVLPCLQKYFGSKVAENPRVAMSAKILWFKSGGEPQGGGFYFQGRKWIEEVLRGEF
jgi:hypothetical protein